MRLVCLSISHKNADVRLRERLALSRHEVPEILSLMLEPSLVHEGMCLSTCNRTELYAVMAPEGGVDLAVILAAFKAVPSADVYRVGRLLRDQDAVTHIMRLVCGLESMIVGETEILGQVKRAYATALAHDAAGRILNLLFQRSFSLAKHIHAGVAFDRSRVSVAGVAVDEIARRVGDLATARITVWGTGSVGRAVVRGLLRLGVVGGTVLSRDLHRARVLAHEWHGRAEDSSHAESLLCASDIFVTCTGASHQVVHADMLRERKFDRPLLLLDLAVPRDVDAEVSKMSGVEVIDMDLLGRVAQQGMQERQAMCERLAPMIAAEAEAAWLCANACASEQCLAAWKQEARRILAEEQKRVLTGMSDLPPELLERFTTLGERLLERLLRRPNKAMARALRQGLPCAEMLAVMHEDGDRDVLDES